MIVVSDTSPITNLAAIGQLGILRELYSAIHVPSGVVDELNAGESPWPGAAEVAAADWIQHHEVGDERLVRSLARDLGRGESESIALSLELEANRLLIDEKSGRHAARRMGVPILGVLGVLLEAKSRGLLAELAPCLRALRFEAGFYLTDTLVHAVLREAGEEDTDAT